MKKVCSILILIILLLNSSAMILISEAIDAVNEEINKPKTMQEIALEKYVNYSNIQEKGTMVQFKVIAGLQEKEEEELLYKSATVELECPKISEKAPTRVEVLEHESSYEDGKITITDNYEELQNYESGQEYTVIMFYDEECYTEDAEERVLDAKLIVKYELEGDTITGETTLPEEQTTVTEQIGEIVSAKYETEPIYDGYIKTNIANGKQYDTEYQETTEVMISNKNIAPIFTLTENMLFVLDEDEIANNQNALYKDITIEKAKVEKILGENGQIQLLNENDEVLVTINKNEEANEDGNYVQTFEEPVQSIKLKIENIQAEGIVEFKTTKVIKSTLEQEVDAVKNIMNVEGIIVETVEEEDNEEIQEETTENDEEKQDEVITTEKTKVIYSTTLSEEIEIQDSQNKMSISIDETELTNNVQNEITITAILEKDLPDCNLYSDPIIYIEFPQEIEKIILGDVQNPLYDSELTLKSATVETTSEGNKAIRIELSGKQTEYQTEDITKGTNIIIPATVILKQEMESNDSTIKMICNGTTVEQSIKLVSKNENEVVKNETSTSIGEIVNVDGIKVETKAIRGDTVLNNNDTVYEREIIKYEVKITNTTEQNIDNVKIVGNIPEGMTYVDLVEGTFYEEYYQFVPNTERKQKEIEVGTIEPGQTVEYYYQVKINDLDENESEIEINVEIKTYTGETEISTYNIKNIVKQAEFEVEIKSAVSRKRRGQWAYEIVVKNISGEEQKDILVTLPFSEHLEIDYMSFSSSYEPTYEKENGYLTIKLDSIASDCSVTIFIYADVVNIEENEDCTYEIVMTADVKGNSGIIYKSNENIVTGGIEAVKISQSSDKSGETVNVGDEITYIFEIENIGNVVKEYGEYTEVKFDDYIPNELEVLEIQYNNNIIKSSNKEVGETSITERTTEPYTVDMDPILISNVNQKDNSDEARLHLDLVINLKETCTIKIKTKVRTTFEDVDIENFGTVTGDYIKTKQSNVIKNTIKAYQITDETINPDDSTDSDNTDNSENPANPDNPATDSSKKYEVSGMVWIDANENGRRDELEENKSGIEVLLFDVINNKFIRDENNSVIIKNTNDNGEYKFENVEQGNYYVIFRYDSEQYNITEYKKLGVSTNSNSDVIAKEATILGEIRTIGISDTIELRDDVIHIDMGLIENKVFDLKIEKYIQKITVQIEDKTKQYNYENKKFAKIEIPAKKINNSTAVLEYKIVITNVGELTGTVNEIIDELPKQLEFHSELNTNWSKAMTNKASNISLGRQEIKPGESIETTIILTKTLDEKSVGTFTNVAQIGISDNTKHIDDSNTNNDRDQVEVVISVSTGSIAYIGKIIWIVALALIIILILKKLQKSKIFKAMFVIIIAFGIVIMPINNVYGYTLNVHIWGNVNPYGVGGGVPFHDAYGRYYVCATVHGAMCASHGHDYYGEITREETRTGQVSYSGDFGLEKVSTDKIEYQGEKDGYDIYGPFKFKCIDTLDSSSGNPSYSIQIKGTLSMSGSPENISDYKILQKNGTEYVTTNLASETSFYIGISKNVYQLSYVKIDAYKSATVTEYYTWKESGLLTTDWGRNNWSWAECSCHASVEDDLAGIHGCLMLDENGNWIGNDNMQDMWYEESGEDSTTTSYNWSASIEWLPEEMPKVLRLVKKDYDNQQELLKDVEFKFQETTKGYVKQLANGKIEYVSNESEATIFKTDANGSITIKGLLAGTYKAIEVNNPWYGYYNITNVNANRVININSTSTTVEYVTLNKKFTGNLFIEKIDSNDSNIKLAGVEFKIKDLNGKYISVQIEGKTGYQSQVTGTATITAQRLVEKAEDGTTFITDANGIIKLYNIELQPANDTMSSDVVKEYIIEEINNPNYGYEADGNYISWNINGTTSTGKSTKVKITRNKSTDTSTTTGTKVTVNNRVKFVKLSGFVWEDIAVNKSNTIDNVYIPATNDKLVEGIKVILHDYKGDTYEKWTDENGAYSYENILIDRLDEYYIEFEYNGMKYTNVTPNVEVTNVEEYYSSNAIESAEDRTEFNNKYSIIEENGVPAEGETTTSKAPNYSEEGTTIQYTNEEDYKSFVTYTEGNEYYNDYCKQNGIKLNDYYAVEKYHISASTKALGYNLKDAYIENEKEITNINLGICQREQITLAVSSDIEDVLVKLNGYTHTYHYASRRDYQENDGAFNVGVKFGNKYSQYVNRYTRTMYQSSISWNETVEPEKNKIEVNVIYKISLKNSSTNLKAKVNEIINYYDNDYTVEEIYYMNGNEKVEITDKYYQEDTHIENKLNKMLIKTSENPGKIIIDSGKQFDVYINFKISDSAIKGLLNESPTLYDVTEISSYSTLDKNENAYASIDIESAPGNAKVNLVYNETDKVDNIETNRTLENDTDIAPSLLLQADKNNEIVGNVWEDSAIQEKLNENNERIGNGIYEEDRENTIYGVKVELIETDDDGKMIYETSQDEDGNEIIIPKVAKLYQLETNNGVSVPKQVEASVITDENGEYKLSGIIPDEYILRYTYGDESYIVEYGTGEKTRISARDYKSTIIASDVIKEALQIDENGYAEGRGNYNWNTVKELDAENNIIKYSDAVDEIEKRIGQEDEPINYKTVTEQRQEGNLLIDNTMSANTATFSVGVEFTEIVNKASSSYVYDNDDIDEEGNIRIENGEPARIYFLQTLENVDFGIILRARVDIGVDKKISNVSVVLANGQIILDGNPSDANVDIPYTKVGLDDYVPIEIDREIIQGATLKMTYDITVTNNSELNYEYRTGDAAGIAGRKYYYFGTKEGASEVYSEIELVADYLDGELVVESEKLQGWNDETAVDKRDVSDNLKEILKAGKNVTAEMLYNNGLISGDVKTALEEKDYTIFLTTEFNDVTRGNSKTLSFEVSKLLASGEETVYFNNTEILQLSGQAGRSIMTSTPGNLVPEESHNPEEQDEDIVTTVITPPTGSISNIQYLIIFSSLLVVLVLGINIIKKKVLE